MQEIKLSQGLVAFVDDEDFRYLNKFKWHASRSGNTFYAQREVHINGHRTSLKMHRAILHDAIQVDHIDGNGLNNQRDNLRPVTNAQNCFNQRKKNGQSTSKYKGVTLHKRDTRWYASIRFKGKLKHLGSFVSEIEAALAYDKAALDIFGEFARLNFPKKEHKNG